VRALSAKQFSSLSVHNYRVFFFGQLVSLVGTWMQSVGLAWLVLDKSGSSLLLGIVTTLQFLPMMLFALVGGVVADRLPKRPTLIIVQSFAGLTAALLGALTITGLIEIWQIFILAFATGLASAIERPVRQSFYFELVGRDSLPNAVALHSTILNGSRVLGPAIAGIVIATTDVSFTFIFNAASYFAVVYSYALMKPADYFRTTTTTRTSPGNVLQQIAEGLHYSITVPSAAFVFILIAFIGTFGYNFNVTVPLIAKFILHAGPAQFGLMTSALGVGSLVAALIQAGAGARSSQFLTLSAGAFSICFAVLALSKWSALSAVMLALTGASGTMLMTSANTTLQLEAPDHLRGRVVSVYLLLMAGSTPIGAFLTGSLSQLTSVQWAILIEAILCGVGVIGAEQYRRVKSGSVGELSTDVEEPTLVR
jgi:MFS family permease